VDLEKYFNINQRDYESVAGPDWPSYDQFQRHESVASFVYSEIDAMLSGPKIFNNPAFCVLPFYGLEIPDQVTCCLLPDGHDIEQIKSDMLQGKRPTDCNKCWDLEDAGFKSDRMIKNETVDFYSDLDISLLFDQCQQGKNTILHYKIDTSNTCNATCITCSSYHSSSWAQLESRNNTKPYKNWSLTFDQSITNLDFAQAKSIGFRGGEPLLSRTNFEILEKLLYHGNTNCFINFTTNGSVVLTQSQLQVLSQFSNINMCFSIDGVGPVFEYMRYPLKWEALLKNIEICRAHNIMVSANFTVSNLNLIYFTEITNWFDQNKINYLVNFVYRPEHFRPGALPAHVKHKILQKLNDSRLDFLRDHMPADDHDYKKFCQEIRQQDNWKGISMQDYLPELCRLLD
jgi:4Fe-4S single cluster domain